MKTRFRIYRKVSNKLIIFYSFIAVLNFILTTMFFIDKENLFGIYLTIDVLIVLIYFFSCFSIHRLPDKDCDFCCYFHCTKGKFKNPNCVQHGK